MLRRLRSAFCIFRAERCREILGAVYGSPIAAMCGTTLNPDGAQLPSTMLKHLTSPLLICCLSIGALYTLSSCAANGRTKAEIEYKIPLGPDIKVSYDSHPAPTGTTTVTGLPPGKCLKTTYTDSDGNELPSGPVWTPIDGTGTASAPVPANAVRFQSSVEDCPPDPEPEPGDAGDEEPVPPGTGGGSGSGGMFQIGQAGQANGRTAVIVPTWHFFGGTIAPDDSMGAENLSWSMSVRAATSKAAAEIVERIVDTGIGAIVPSSVIITRYSLTIPTLAGARVVTANPDGIDAFELDLNQGAHIANLATGTNVLTYVQGDWDVVETLLPLSAFNGSILPGSNYENHVDFAWSTTRFQEMSTGHFTLTGEVY